MADEQANLNANPVVGPVEQRSEPPAAPVLSPKPSLIDQYDLGDTGHDAVQAEPPSAESAPPVVESGPEVADSRPRDPETGRFLPKGQHSPRISQMALDYGLSDSEIKDMEPAALEATVYHLHRQALQLRRDNDRERILQAGGENQTPLVSPLQDRPSLGAETPPASLDSAGDDLGPNIDKMIEAGYDKDLLGIIKRQHEELKGLKTAIGQLQQGEQRRQVMTIAAQCDRAFEKHKAILGEGRGMDMQPDDPNVLRRKAVLGLVQTMKQGNLQQRIDKAVETLFGTTAPAPRGKPATETRNGISPDEWDRGGLARPTHRAGAPEPKGVALAEKSVAAALRELQSTEEDLPADSFLE